MMRKLLNNPKVILPLAVIALLWVLVSYGVISPKDLDLFNSGSSATPTFSVARESPEPSESDRAVESLIKEQWLPRSWQKYSVIKHEPFVADFVFDELEELIPIGEPEQELEVVLLLEPETVEELDSYIVEHLGLDENGFFVRFGSIRKREGDILRATDGRELVLGSIALAEERRTDAEHDATVALHLIRMQLQAVIKNTPVEIISTASSTKEDAALLPPSLPGDNSFEKEEPVVDADSVYRFDENQTTASAVISGGQLERQIYRLGEFVQKNPALGLAEVHEDYVQLVDRYGKFYRLNLKD